MSSPKPLSDPTLIPLPLLSARLAALTGRPAPGYHRALVAACNRLLPAERIGARWYVLEKDLEEAAVVLGMIASATT
jgi:hypothetical protein